MSPASTYSSIAISEGISDHRRAYFTGVTCSWGSRSTCIWSISRQKDALRSYGKFSSDMQRRMRSTSSWPDISFMAKYCRSRHILAKRLSWYLWGGGEIHKQTAYTLISRTFHWITDKQLHVQLTFSHKTHVQHSWVFIWICVEQWQLCFPKKWMFNWKQAPFKSKHFSWGLDQTLH